MPREYNDPLNADPSSIGTQFNTFYWDKKALIEARKLEFFTPLAEVISMPKNMGKKIKKYLYLPMLDDRNVNDQGIDAAGAVITNNWKVVFPAARTTATFAVEADATLVAAGMTGGTKSGSVTPWTVTFGSTTSILFTSAAAAAAMAESSNVRGAVTSRQGGNLYGSSKDVGTITGKIPLLSESGGRVNRVGFKRVDLEGSMYNMGIFDEYSQDSIDFDTDEDLEMHIRREMLGGATELTEAILQKDILNSAGTIRYPGVATSKLTLTAATQATFGDLMRLSIDLDNNRTPKQTKVITGTRLIDTKTIAGGRVMYHGSEVIPLLKAMVDLHANEAFIPVQMYAAGTTVLNGEHGAIGDFRLINVPEMQSWQGAGADASATATHHETGQAYDVFPLLCVGDGAFTTIGFNTDGKSTKFKIIHKPPGEKTADKTDPYGKTGFMSIAWWYGFMNLRPERIGMILTTAPL